MQRAQGLIEDNVSEAAKEETLIEQAKHAAADLVAAKKEFAKADARARKYEQVFDKLMVQGHCALRSSLRPKHSCIQSSHQPHTLAMCSRRTPNCTT